MTFVYVIVNSPGDYIIEQAMVSMHSLRMYNPEAHITAVMDADTLGFLKGKRAKIKKYINNIVASQVSEEMTAVQKSRFLKTSLRKLIKGDFLFLDTDTVVTDSLSEIPEMQYDVAQVLDMNCENFNRDNPDPMIDGYLKITGRDILKETDIDQYFNSGVIFSQDTEIAHEFYNRWHQLWIKDSMERGFHKDQVAEWVANSQMGNIIHELDAKYNCQFTFAVNALRHIDSAKILHYIGSTHLGSCLRFTNEKHLKRISDNGIEEEDERYIRNIKSIYLNILKRITDAALRNYSVNDTTLVVIARKISYRFPWANNLLGSLINFLSRFKALFTKKKRALIL